MTSNQRGIVILNKYDYYNLVNIQYGLILTSVS